MATVDDLEVLRVVNKNIGAWGRSIGGEELVNHRLKVVDRGDAVAWIRRQGLVRGQACGVVDVDPFCLINRIDDGSFTGAAQPTRP